MKSLRNMLDRQTKHFTKGGRFEKYFPLHDAIDSLLFKPGVTTQTFPHVRDAFNIKRATLIFMVSLIPVLCMAIYNTGLQANLAYNNSGITLLSGWRGMFLQAFGLSPDPGSFAANAAHGLLHFLPILLVALAAGLFWEALFSVIRQRQMNEMMIITALLFALILPPTTPWWQVVLGVSFGVIIGKEIYGGFGKNVLNPALMGYAFLFFGYPAQISGDKVWVAMDGITRASPLAEFSKTASLESVTWMDAFLGFIPGSMGETSTLACLIGAAILLVTGIASWRIMVSILAGMICLSLLFNLIGSTTNPMFQMTPLWHLVTGSFAFGTVFMATDPVTSAATHGGQYFYGLLIGLLIVLIRVVNPAFPEGVMLAILFGNIFAPSLDKIMVHRNIKRRNVGYAK